jgi:hypothetical protein
MAGLKSECMADIASEQLADFVEIRIQVDGPMCNMAFSAVLQKGPVA